MLRPTSSAARRESEQATSAWPTIVRRRKSVRPTAASERDARDQDVLRLDEHAADVPGVVGDPAVRARDVAELEQESASARNDAPSVMIMLASCVVRPRKPTATTARIDAAAAAMSDGHERRQGERQVSRRSGR